MYRAFLAAAAWALAASAAAFSVVPAEPSSFDPVNLRMSVDACAFVPSTVHVSLSANTFHVTQQPNFCLVAGATEIADVRLGTLPPGEYRVELYGGPQATGTPVQALSFEVRERPEIAIFPPPPRPITDYTGVWWSPQESGWGLSLHQSATGLMFGAWFVYGTGNLPEWYTLQGGQWTSSTHWNATLYRTTGPSFSASVFDPALVMAAPVGSAALEFKQVPGAEGLARFTYTVNGATVTKTIQRMAF
jgi:hypothetical protein